MSVSGSNAAQPCAVVRLHQVRLVAVGLRGPFLFSLSQLLFHSYSSVIYLNLNLNPISLCLIFYRMKQYPAIALNGQLFHNMDKIAFFVAAR